VPGRRAGDRHDDADRTCPSPEHQIRRFYGITLALREAERTADLLADTGCSEAGRTADRRRFHAPGPYGRVVDPATPSIDPARGGVGTVHHVASVADGLD
jgi:hypothetical protein